MRRTGIGVFQNEPRSEAAYTYLGVSSRGTPVWVDTEVAKRDVIIAQANHWGYGGGKHEVMTRKQLTPVTLEENLEMAADIGMDARTSLDEASSRPSDGTAAMRR